MMWWWAPLAIAQDLGHIQDITDLDLQSLLGSVESASAVQESRATAPAAVSVLSREDILATGAKTIPALLGSLPGVHVTHITPGIVQVSLRGTAGLQGNNVVVLLDGVRINSTIDGTTDWEAVPVGPEDLLRIEVVRGPVSAVYGADAFTGVVHLITRRVLPDGVDVSGAVHQGVDPDAGDSRAKVSASWQGGRTTVAVGAHARDDRTFGHEEAFVQSAAGRFMARTRWRDFEAQATLDVARTRRLWMDHLVTRPVETDADDLGGSLKAQWTPGWQWLDALKLSSSHRVMGLALPSGAEPRGFSYTDTRIQDSRTSLSLAARPTQQLNLSLGGEAGWELVDSAFLHAEETDIMRGRYAASGALRWQPLEHWVWSASSRLDLSSRLQTPKWAGRTSVVYLRDDLAVRASVGHAFRQPSYVELGARLVDPTTNLILLEGDGGFEAPTLDSAELGVLAAAPYNGLTVEPVVFVQRLRDLAVMDFEPLAKKTFRNDADDVVIGGLELDLRWSPDPWTALWLRGTHLVWLSERTDGSATVAVQEQNPSSEIWMGGRGGTPRIEGMLQLGLQSPRTFDVRGGIPPLDLALEVPTLTPIEAGGHLFVMPDKPWVFYVRGLVYPQQSAQFPLDEAGVPTRKLTVGFEVRPRE